MNWLFISIGFVGTLPLCLASVYNLVTCLKNKSFKRISLVQQLSILFGNICFFVFALGLSIINIGDSVFWNSSPTWVANLILMILNTSLVFGKINNLRQTENK